jgi:thiamine biosynthesis lipoprotein
MDSGKKVANGLVVLSSAAVLAVYTAGYLKTQSAAERFESQAAGRRPGIPGPARTAPQTAEFGAPTPNAPGAGTSLPAASATINEAVRNSGSITVEENAPTAVLGAAPSPAPSLPPEAAPVARQAVEPDAPMAEHRTDAPAAAPLWKDGTYYGWGTSRHGNIQAAVVIEGGRITSAAIAQCLTRYSCSVIANLPPQVAQRQNAEVDYVSGATQSADARSPRSLESGEVSRSVIARTEVVMSTPVTIQVVNAGAAAGADSAIGRAFGWFHEIEERCTRFDMRSELMRLTAQTGVPVPASTILYEAVRFALQVAEESGGAFDPTVGHRMEAHGFNREYRTGERVRSAVAPEEDVNYRDVELDPDRRAITVHRPLTLDLGAVAKGLAIDTAARELAPFRDFAIDAGGDLYLGGVNPQGALWSVGIRHPRRDDELIDFLRVSNQAVCTSGDYERTTCGAGDAAVARQHALGHHILDPRTGTSSRAAASATVVAPGAMLADALATAAFVLGPVDGIRLFNRMGVDGLIVTPELQRYETRGLCHAA